mmetsp:Transcript_23121/g.35670  ORF Transcript_23121/g.35670 Transcript_23121/m.35670 type:complete len:299 (-) Transcript_23121:44-940(-)
MRLFTVQALLLALTSFSVGEAFVPSSRGFAGTGKNVEVGTKSSSALRMGLDLVTYLRTEWISAALCTNQTPREADVCLQLGVEDGRAITFIPRTIRELITSSAEADGKLTVTARRQLKQQKDRRSGSANIQYVDQPSDDLRETPDESVDVVISLQAAARMAENGLDWKKSVQEAARVLKPGGRLLFCEQTELGGTSYVDYVAQLSTVKAGEEDLEDAERFLVFEEGGVDDVDLVLTPHVAGVAIKSEDGGLTAEERSAKKAQEEKDRVADISISAFERGLKKRKKKKKKVVAEDESSA